MRHKENRVEIALYEPWMDWQIAELISLQYGRDRETQQALLRAVYDHPYQRDRCIRVVAMDGERVVGFQSYLYWPYLLEGRTLNTYQSGNSLVSPDYRGRRVFASLLEFIDNHPELRTGIDFLVGFPIETSYKSLLFNKWSNVLDLDWFVRPSALLALVRDTRNSRVCLGAERMDIHGRPISPGFELNWTEDFHKWRTQLPRDSAHCYFHHADGSRCVRFDLKIRSRGGIWGLTVGRVTTNNRENGFLAHAVSELVRAVARQRVFSYISFAYNSLYHDTSVIRAFRHCFFFPICRHIHFLVKAFKDEPKSFRPELWELFRSDADTW